MLLGVETHDKGRDIHDLLPNPTKNNANER
jgi:hypothetical protein